MLFRRDKEKMIRLLKRLFKREKDDGFDKARENVAKECLKRGGIISGKMYEDGTYTIDEEGFCKCSKPEPYYSYNFSADKIPCKNCGLIIKRDNLCQ